MFLAEQEYGHKNKRTLCQGTVKAPLISSSVIASLVTTGGPVLYDGQRSTKRNDTIHVQTDAIHISRTSRASA